jgi:hypothetical protein
VPIRHVEELPVLVSSSSTLRRPITDGGYPPSWNPFNGDHGRLRGTGIHSCCHGRADRRRILR